MPEFIRVEQIGAVAVIRLDRPPVNAICRSMHQPLTDAAVAVAADPAVRAVVLTGGDRAFAAGADISEMAGASVAEMEAYGSSLTAAIDAVARIAKPVIAAITGYALGGGCELALAADFRVIAEDARIGLPEIMLGVIPGGGGTQRLPRLIGVTKAKELIFGGRPVRGPEALVLGLASRCVAADQVWEVAMGWATELAQGPTLALSAAKSAIDYGSEADLATGLRLEQRAFVNLFDTADQRAGMQSFLESGPGKAAFTGR